MQIKESYKQRCVAMVTSRKVTWPPVYADGVEF